MIGVYDVDSKQLAATFQTGTVEEQKNEAAFWIHGRLGVGERLERELYVVELKEV